MNDIANIPAPTKPILPLTKFIHSARENARLLELDLRQSVLHSNVTGDGVQRLCMEATFSGYIERLCHLQRLLDGLCREMPLSEPYRQVSAEEFATLMEFKDNHCSDEA